MVGLNVEDLMIGPGIELENINQARQFWIQNVLLEMIQNTFQNYVVWIWRHTFPVSTPITLES